MLLRIPREPDGLTGGRRRQEGHAEREPGSRRARARGHTHRIRVFGRGVARAARGRRAHRALHRRRARGRPPAPRSGRRAGAARPLCAHRAAHRDAAARSGGAPRAPRRRGARRGSGDQQRAGGPGHRAPRRARRQLRRRLRRRRAPAHPPDCHGHRRAREEPPAGYLRRRRARRSPTWTPSPPRRAR